MNEKSMARDLTEGNVWKKLIIFALPFMLANLLQTLYTMVDAMIVGQFVGAEALAAVTTCGTLVEFYMSIGIGFASAGQIIIAQYLGQKNSKAVSKAIGTLFSFLLILAICMSIFCLATLDMQLNWMNVPEESYIQGRYYTITCACGFVFIYGYNCVASILRGMGDSKHPLVFVAIASGMNVVLDLLFVVGFQLGAFGAALATIAGQGFSFIVSMLYLYKRKVAFGFDFKLRSFVPTKNSLSMLMRLGIPMALQHAAILISMLYVNSLINAYGVAAAAVNGVGMKLEGILRIVSNSMATAGSSMIAQCLGAGKKERIPKIVNCIIVVCEAEALAFSLILFFFPQQVFGLFNTDPEVLALCTMYRGPAIVGYFGFGLRAAYNSVINGIGFASLGMVIGLLDGVVARIGLSLLFGSILGYGLIGFWYGSALAGYVTAVIGAIYYYSGLWKKREIITKKG